MNAAWRIAAFAVGLVVVFVVALWVGKAIGPEGGAAVRQAPMHDDTHAAHDATAAEPLGPALMVGANLHVAGQYDPQPLPPVAATSVVDGYTVAQAGTPKANEPSMLTLTVSRNGKPVTDLQPYLGAYGHLVAPRAADLAYLHVHPMGEPGDRVTPAGPDIGFHATFPSAGEYRLFLDIQHAGVVRTAEFAVPVGNGEAS